MFNRWGLLGLGLAHLEIFGVESLGFRLGIEGSEGVGLRVFGRACSQTRVFCCICAADFSLVRNVVVSPYQQACCKPCLHDTSIAKQQNPAHAPLLPQHQSRKPSSFRIIVALHAHAGSSM